MSTFRIRTEFDVEILDEAAARQIARQFMIQRVDAATLNGEEIRTSTATPAEAIDVVLDAPKALASLVATVMLSRAGAGMPGARLSNLNVEHL